MGEGINILFLGGAKRVSMARFFKDAAKRRGAKCTILSYEMTKNVPIVCEAEVIIGLRWFDPDVFDDMHRLVVERDISIIIPFVDGAVEVAAEYSRRYPGEAFVPASDVELCRRMFDKVASAAVFEELGLPIPRTYRAGDPCLRLIAKPRRGSASKGIITINSLDALDSVLARADEYLVQERIDSREEYTVDCYVECRSGRICLVSPRRRIEVVGGEVSRTATVADSDLIELSERVLRLIGLRGAVTLQFMRDLDYNGRLLLMEINPRLGGGAVCTVCAGASIPELILADAVGEMVPCVTPKPGVEIARYMQEVVFMPD